MKKKEFVFTFSRTSYQVDKRFAVITLNKRLLKKQ